MFTSKCFIRKNTPELINKLIDLGYVKALFDEEYTKSEAYGLIVDQGDIAPLEHTLQEDELMFTYNFIDCGENVGLFLSLAALRDDSDYMQWFMNNYGYCNICCDKNVEDYKSGYGKQMYRIIDETYHKMSAEELIEHAEIIEKRYEI